jgi:N-hydroxyarylamine O-acetyltransferase
VGFGDSFRQPLSVDRREVQVQRKRSYQICDEGNRLRLKENIGNGNWKTHYRFTLQPHDLADFTEMCRYHQTSPESIFTQRLVCSKAKPDGRVTLNDMRLIKTIGNGQQERIIADEKEYREMLVKEFDIIY